MTAPDLSSVMMSPEEQAAWASSLAQQAPTPGPAPGPPPLSAIASLAPPPAPNASMMPPPGPPPAPAAMAHATPRGGLGQLPFAVPGQPPALPFEARRAQQEAALYGNPANIPPPAPTGPAAPAKRNPADLSFASSGGSGSDAAARAALALAMPRAVNVAAAETPRIAPGRIRAIEDAGREEQDARRDMAAAQMHEAEAQGVGAALHGQKLGEQATDVQAKAAQRDQFIADQQAKIDAVSADVASQKIDPDRWWHNQKTGSKIAYAIAAGLGGFLEGFRGTPNRALETIQGHINNDIAAQREAIESKKGRVKDMQGILAETYRRFGNMEQAESAARVIALQQVDAEQQAYAASSASEKVQAESRVQSAQIQDAKQKELAGLYSYVPAHTAAAGGATPAELARARVLYDKSAENGKNISFQDALAEALGERLGTGALGSATFGKGEGTPEQRYKKYVDTIVEKGETPLSLDEWQKKTSGETSSAPGATVPKPESTAWSLAHVLPGGSPQFTEAFAKENVQARYNAAVTKGVIDRYGRGAERNEKLIESLMAAYRVDKGDSQETIERKIAAAHRDLGIAAGGATGPNVGFTPIGQ